MRGYSTLQRVARLNIPHHRRIQTPPASSRSRSRTLRLPDGRVLGFAEYGSPSGRPVLYFHGFPSSRLEAQPVHEIAQRCGIRLLALDRPGFGLSSPQKDRKIMDWPNDVLAFATGMGLDRFAVLGVSAGGPFALACAHALPKHMLAGVGLFASGGPWEVGAHLRTFTRRVARFVVLYWPSAFRFLFNVLVRQSRAKAKSGSKVSRVDAWSEAQEGKKKEKGLAQIDDGQTGKTPQERSKYDQNTLMNGPFAQGAAATVQEAALLYSLDWGFKFENVNYNPVRIWHGAEDRNVPIEAIRYLAQRLPHAVMTEYESDTHYTIFKRLEGALTQLAKDFDAHASGDSSLST